MNQNCIDTSPAEQAVAASRGSCPLNRRAAIQRLLGAVLVPAASTGLSACFSADIPKLPLLPPGATIVTLGDSLTSGFGAGPTLAWPAALQRKVPGIVIENQGLSGDTTAGGLIRLQERVVAAASRTAPKVEAVIIALGGNDMLRRVPDERIVANLIALVKMARAVTRHVALMATPRPSVTGALVGSLSDAEFYERIAGDERVLLIPAIYAKVLSDNSLKSDKIHANARGYAVVAEGVRERLIEAGWIAQGVVGPSAQREG